MSRLRVRAEVDERDISHVKIGQRVSIISEFDKSLQLKGNISQIENEMGRRTIKSTDPADKNGRDVLEVVIDLDASAAGRPLVLLVGLRVVAVFGR
jgi:multidrug resistance efflux pump